MLDRFSLVLLTAGALTVGGLTFGPLTLRASTARAAEPGVTDTHIILGAHSYLTGNWSIYGVYSKSQRAYYEMINDKGGIHGRKIKLLVEDSAGNPQQALQATKKLVERDRIFAMAGSIGVVHLPSAKYLQQKKVPDLWIADLTTSLTTPTHRTTFAHHPTFQGEAEFLANLVLKKWPGKKVGLLVGDFADMKAEADIFKRVLKGKNEVIVEIAPLSSANTHAQVLNLKKAGAEVVYLQTYVHLTTNFVKFATEQGFKPQYVTGFLSSNNVFLDRLKDSAENTYGWHYVYHETDTDQPGIRQHLEILKKYLPNEIPSVQTIIGQAQAETVVETLRRAGKDLTREKLIKAAETFDNWKCSVCRTGNSTSPQKHRFNTNYTALVVKGGKWVAAEPLTGK